MGRPVQRGICIYANTLISNSVTAGYLGIYVYAHHHRLYCVCLYSTESITVVYSAVVSIIIIIAIVSLFIYVCVCSVIVYEFIGFVNRSV